MENTQTSTIFDKLYSNLPFPGTTHLIYDTAGHRLEAMTDTPRLLP
jgi:hypothetical protein